MAKTMKSSREVWVSFFLSFPDSFIILFLFIPHFVLLMGVCGSWCVEVGEGVRSREVVYMLSRVLLVAFCFAWLS